MEHVCVTVCVSVIEHSCVLTRSMQVHGCVIHRAQSQRQESHGSGKSHRTTATGLPGVGRRPGKARYWGPDHVDKHKHTHKHKRKYTYTYTYTYTHTHTRTEPFHSSSFTSPPSVLVTAIRPCHRLSLISRPCPCHSSMSLPSRRHSSFSPRFAAIRLPWAAASSFRQPHPRCMGSAAWRCLQVTQQSVRVGEGLACTACPRLAAQPRPAGPYCVGGGQRWQCRGLSL